MATAHHVVYPPLKGTFPLKSFGSWGMPYGGQAPYKGWRVGYRGWLV